MRYVLRKNETEAARERHRLEDKLAKLEKKIAARNEETKKKQRCQPEAGKRKLKAWAAQHKLNGLVELKLEGRMLVLVARNGDRHVSGIGGLLRGDHRCIAREHEHARGARQLRQFAEGGARFSRHEDRTIGSAAVIRAQGESHARPRVLLHAGIKTES